MPSCIVRSCSNYSYKASERGVRMHTFPNTLERIKVWLRAIPQQFRDQDSFAEEILKTKKTNPYRICSEHFAQECYTSMNGVMYLSRNAVPTIFGPQVSLTKKRFCVDCKKLIADRCSHCPKHQYVYRGDLWKVHHDHLYPSLSPTLDKTHRGITEASPSHKEPMGMWEEASDPVMGKKDKNEERKERILNLTLEIIYLLTGEEYVPKRKSHLVRSQICTDCLLEGSCKRHVTPAVAHLYRSVIQKENDKKILELISNIIQLLTGEVAIRCEDVSIYFSLEEWEYIKGNKALYREEIQEEEEEPQRLRPLEREQSSEVAAFLEAMVCCKDEPSNSLTEETVLYSEENIVSIELPPAEQPPTANGIKEEAASWEGGNQSDCSINPLTEQIQGTDTPTPIIGCRLDISEGIKEEPDSCKEENQSDYNIITVSEPIQGTYIPSSIMGCSLNNSLSANYIANEIKEEAASWEGGNQSDCSINPLTEQIQGTDTPTPIMGCSLNNSSAEDYILNGIKQEPASCKEGTESPVMGCKQSNSSLVNCISVDIKEEAASSDDGNQSDCSINPLTEQIQGTDTPTPIMGSIVHKPSKNVTRPVRVCRQAKQPSPGGYNGAGYNCAECHKDFSSKSSLVRHQRVHTGTNLFPCNVCGKPFTRLSNLKDHRRTHTGEKPFSCSQCGKCYINSTDLKKHCKSHKARQKVQ